MKSLAYTYTQLRIVHVCEFYFVCLRECFMGVYARIEFICMCECCVYASMYRCVCMQRVYMYVRVFLWVYMHGSSLYVYASVYRCMHASSLYVYASYSQVYMHSLLT